MRKLLILGMLLLAFAASASGQTPAGGYTSPGSSSGSGITPVASLPGSCTATSPPVQLTVAPYGIYVPSFTNGVCSYILDGQLGGALLPATFGIQAAWNSGVYWLQFHRH